MIVHDNCMSCIAYWIFTLLRGFFLSTFILSSLQPVNSVSKVSFHVFMSAVSIDYWAMFFISPVLVSMVSHSWWQSNYYHDFHYPLITYMLFLLRLMFRYFLLTFIIKEGKQTWCLVTHRSQGQTKHLDTQSERSHWSSTVFSNTFVCVGVYPSCQQNKPSAWVHFVFSLSLSSFGTVYNTLDCITITHSHVPSY